MHAWCNRILIYREMSEMCMGIEKEGKKAGWHFHAVYAGNVKEK